jgi:hypothetical protein
VSFRGSFSFFYIMLRMYFNLKYAANNAFREKLCNDRQLFAGVFTAAGLYCGFGWPDTAGSVRFEPRGGAPWQKCNALS